jgi:hypothetical protein
MSVTKKEQVGPFTEDQRKLAAWGNARKTSNDYERHDHRGLPMHWDQFEKRSLYGWLIEYITPLEGGGRDEPSNVRARHWCESRECFEAALQMNL